MSRSERIDRARTMVVATDAECSGEDDGGEAAVVRRMAVW
jgi:hypothetical protein